MSKPFHTLLIRLSAAHRKYCMDQFSQLGLSSGQPRLLELLTSMDGCIQKDLAAACGIETPTLTNILKGMRRAGLIESQEAVSESGKRAYRVLLTDKGREIARKIQGIVEEAAAFALSGFSPGEKTTFLGLMDRCLGNFKNDVQEEN